MIKNFSPGSLGINGRQSELIELALTYGFKGMDVDMQEMLRRAQRSEGGIADASKYLDAAKKQFDIKIGGFDLGINLDADEDAFVAAVGALHPVADLAKQLGAARAYCKLPAATDRLPYHEYFEAQTARLRQIAEVLGARDIKLGIGFSAGKELAEGKEFPFVRNVEGFVSLVKGVGSGAGFYVDTWDWVVGEGAMDQISELSVDQIVAVRLCSLTPEADPAKAQSFERVVPEADGLLNHVKLVAHLASIGFEGPISPGAHGKSYKGQTRESIVQAAQEAIDGIFTEAGLEVEALPKDTIEDIPYDPTPVM
ncbi:sugar phosphate isomerase/epimerase [Rubripirellula amarantea]|uniref:Xylose isomerase-like TIM barrel domain-containing protein n=1 Tax=Rubripirellula amarantea TaxID=2527999 RepID=A0A5C5WXA0_9BACT|nr:TIM barrel protein [Rubripirellula amarantea]MDA8744092.1 sugar phosphate isomerase/epimerase [Rubripirellula amarantea]TWT54515.1 hypothetical protein Pla22_21620 [Rubripirellula amarantea]